ncbi:MAG: protein kinase [Steroidobacteraceae bacterium]
MNSGHVLSARFVLVRPLGQSTVGEVWLAEDRELGGHVALKLLAPEAAGNPVLTEALARECERLKSLVHPNIVRVDGFYREAGQAWIAMEYLAGGDLTQYRGRPAHEALHAVIPVADALAHAHAAGIVHRDVKTTNVLMSIDGSPRLTDFGLALVIEEMPSLKLGAGSPYSMSPEQLGGGPAHPADDVYAFGVLLYELLSGYPPFYPNIDVAKVQSEPAPPLVPRYPVSEDVIALVHRCLEKDPSLRPGMAAIATDLRAALAAVRGHSEGPRAIAAPVLKPPPVTEAPLQARWQRSSTASAGPTPSELRSEGFRKGLTAAALLLLIGAAGVVFFVLPNRIGSPPPIVAAAPAPAPQVEDKALTPAELEALAVLKQKADDVLEALTPRVDALKAKAVELWAADAWTALQAGMSAAAASYATRDYAAATGAYEAAAKSVADLESRAAEVLKDTLARGAAALDSGNAGAAQESYALALQLAPGDAGATQGQRRAQSLDAVVALLAQAEADENEGRLAAAAETFGRAARLDPAMRRATDGLARVQARVAGDAFASAMAQGFTALTAKDYGGARTAFEKARGMRAQAPEVQQALQQLEQEERTATIASRLASARAHEAAEQWQQALADYQAVAALDGTVAAAQQGVERTGPRAALNDELQLYVTQPERLFSAPVRDSATVTLNRAKALSPAGPVLAKQIATLDEWLKRVSVPVQVALESDNVTQVTIYRVGDLGPFTRKAVELTPGRYTVVGTRPGFRDVRREITVVPGAAPAPVVIRCEDRI